MPTAGRLAGALIFLLFGWYLAGLLVPYFPESNAPALLLPICLLVGVLCGWMIIGSRAGRGYVASIGHGLTASFAFSVWILFLVSFLEMIDQSLRRRYDGPMEAIVDVFALMLETAEMFFDVTLIATALIGGVVCAFFAEYFAKRYP